MALTIGSGVTVEGGITAGNVPIPVPQYSYRFQGTGNVTANYLIGNISVFGNVVGTQTNVTAGGTWYNIVFTYNGINNGNLYINGSKVATTGYAVKSNPGGTYLSLGKPDGVGSYLGGVANNFTGNIGAWKVYNKNLSDAEITQNFGALRSRYGI